MVQMNMVEALNSALENEMRLNKNIIVLGEDVGKDGGVFRVTEGLYTKFPGRVLDTPLAESGIVGTAFGLGVAGLRPVAEIQFMGFLYPALDQIISHVSRIRTRSRGRFTCPMVIRAPYTGGFRAPEHHSESTEALFIHIPGIHVVMPSTPTDAKGLLISALREQDPVLFLEPIRLYRAIKEDVSEKPYTIPLGEAKVVKEGDDLTIITWGAMVRPSLAVAEASKSSIEVIDLRTVSPVDLPTILKSFEKTGRAVIVHEAPRTGGFGGELAALIQEKAFLHLEAPIERVAGYDVIFPLYKLENQYLPNEQRIKKAVERALNYES